MGANACREIGHAPPCPAAVMGIKRFVTRRRVRFITLFHEAISYRRKYNPIQLKEIRHTIRR
jgi:hypothetical protein